MAPSTPSSASICVATAPVPGGDSDGAAQKRPAWDSTSDRASKRRASKACLSCRNRKVRCDVVNGGVPCTNCRLDGVQCVTKESNRGRKPAMIVSPVAPQSPPPTLSSHEEDTSPPPHQPDEYLVSLSFEGIAILPSSRNVNQRGLTVHGRSTTKYSPERASRAD